MLLLPKSHHRKLFDDCYPPPKALPTTAPEYRPNANELSRLAYYAQNKPAKLAKVGALLITRSASDAHGMNSSHPDRAKAGLMLTLAITRELSTTSQEGHTYLAQPVYIVLTEAFRAALPHMGMSGWDEELVSRAASTFVTYVSGLPAGVMDVDVNAQHAVSAGIEQMRLASGLRAADTVVPATQFTRKVALYGFDGMIHAAALYTSQYTNIVNRVVPALVVNLSPLHVVLATAQHAAASTTTTGAQIALPELGTEPTNEELALDSASLLRLIVQSASFTQLRAITGAVVAFITEAQLWGDSTWVSWILTQIMRWGQSMSRYIVPLTCVDLLSSSDPHQGSALMLAVRKMLASQTSLAGLNMRELLDKYTSALLERVQANPNDPAITPIIDTIGSFGTSAGGEQTSVLVRDIHQQISALQRGAGKFLRVSPPQRADSIRALLYALVAIVRTRSTEQHAPLPLTSWEPSFVALTSPDAMVRYTYLSALEVFITVELGAGSSGDVLRTLHTYAAAIFVLLSAGICSSTETAENVQRLRGMQSRDTLVSVPADFVGAAATLDELYERIPVPAVIATLPALIALDRLASTNTVGTADLSSVQRRAACRQLVGHVLAKLGTVTNSPAIAEYADLRIRNYVGDLRLQAPLLPSEFGPTQLLSSFAAQEAELGPSAENVNEIAELVAHVPMLQNAVPGGLSIQTWILREWTVPSAIGNAQAGPANMRSASMATLPAAGGDARSGMARGVSLSSVRSAPRSALNRDSSTSVGQLRSVLLGGGGGSGGAGSGMPQTLSTSHLAAPSSAPAHLIGDQSFDTVGTDARSTATTRVRRRARSIYGSDNLPHYESVVSTLDRFSGVEGTPAAAGSTL